MTDITDTIVSISEKMYEDEKDSAISFSSFIEQVKNHPRQLVRNVFQVFHDMVFLYVGEGYDEYLDMPENEMFKFYDFSRLLVEGHDRPFLADRIFSNKIVDLAKGFKVGTQQNKIYIFEGPPGSGKTTFLNNLLKTFEEYSNSQYGQRYETVWRIRPSLFQLLYKADIEEDDTFDSFNKPYQTQESYERVRQEKFNEDGFFEIRCPNHCHPFLIIPKSFRRIFWDEIFDNDEFKWRLFTEKEYDWVFSDEPCTICISLYKSVLKKVLRPDHIFKMIYAKPYSFSRRLGQGISVYNPGDRGPETHVQKNRMLQTQIDRLLKDSDLVKYIYSTYSNTNNGIYALMDIKSNNIERLIKLHNVVSDGSYRVESMEERVSTLFFATLNPEDKNHISNIHSFAERIEYINVPYVIDYMTEVEIYRHVFGRDIDDYFLPRVLQCFSRVMISTRLSQNSKTLSMVIKNPARYSLYCDDQLLLLKMDIYAGHLPAWLTDDDRKKFDTQVKMKIYRESENEGTSGISTRDSIKIFSEFYNKYRSMSKLITIYDVINFFQRKRKSLIKIIPEGFSDSLLKMYDYNLLQEFKESLYYFNSEAIYKNISNYLYAINFTPPAVEFSTYTGDRLDITEKFFEDIEEKLVGPDSDIGKRLAFRELEQKRYISYTLNQEINIAGKPIAETRQFMDLYERYVYNISESGLLLHNEHPNLAKAIQAYDTEEFKIYGRQLREEVTFLIQNLCQKYSYTEKGAKSIALYVIEKKLHDKYAYK